MLSWKRLDKEENDYNQKCFNLKYFKRTTKNVQNLQLKNRDKDALLNFQQDLQDLNLPSCKWQQKSSLKFRV